MVSSSQRRAFVSGFAKIAALIGAAAFVSTPSPAAAADLLVADRLSNSVYRYSSSGALLGTVIGNSPDLNQPTGIGMSPDFKQLFVTSSQNNRVMKYDYDAVTGAATNPTIFADATGGLAFPNDIQFSPDGTTLYVANLDGGVSRFNPDGTSAGSKLVLPGNAGSAAMAFMPDGRLLAGAFTQGAIAISNADRSAFPGYLVQPTPAITGATGLMTYDGNLYVSGLFTTSIRRFSLASGQIDSAWAISGVPFPQDLAIAPDGKGFLAGILGLQNGAGNISRYKFDGTPMGTFAEPSEGGFTEATAFVVVPNPLGDFNGDHVVDAADYVVWRKASPTSTLPNDRTPGIVDASDYADWRANFAKAVPANGAALGTATVPEPGSVLLLFVALMTIGASRSRL